MRNLTAKIVIASTLKPVWDPRAYEKIGQSLASTGLYEISIIGSGKRPGASDKISLLPHDHPASLSKRLFLPWIIYRKIVRIKPALLIISTHELILPAVLLKLLHNIKLIYDIRENYNYNLRYQGIYPPVIRDLMAWYIRTKEVLLQSFFSLFIIAEKCYVDEIAFLKKHPQKSLILENKCARIFEIEEQEQGAKIELLFAGTISEIYGVLEALEFYEHLPPEQFTLTIIGHCPSQALRQHLRTRTAKLNGVKLLISAQPIPHEEIGSRFTNKTIGLLPYRRNKSIENKVPTKLFEYLAHEIPVLVSPHPTWEEIVKNHGKGLPVDFTETPNNSKISAIFNLYSNHYSVDLKHLMWNSTEKYFLSAVEKILSI